MDTADLYLDLLKDGGFTVNVQTGHKPWYGYMVSLPNLEEKAHISALTPDVLQSYIDRNSDILGQDGMYLGGWWDKEDDSVYLDVSVKSDNLSDAVTLAYKYHQIAIYDMENDKEIRIGQR